ncbi:hypothetical protein [Streptomyces sp. NPDC018693]|uniref:hypothetical protein n=1 Tax=unclassified Streptomyces TaxID=2593676 RepID=UPI00378D9565
MVEHGFTADGSALPRPHGVLTLRTDFRADGAPWYETAVTAYYADTGGLMAVAVDALRGPQVFVDGDALIGRPPSHVTEELHARAQARGLLPGFSVEGDASSHELGLPVRAQRAGDALLTRAFFTGPFAHWAGTVHDCVPSHEWHIR